MKNWKLFEPLVNKDVPRIVYCANGDNLPPQGQQVNAFCRVPTKGRLHNTLISAYWLELDSGKLTWYVGDTEVKAPIVAWIYIPADYTICNEKLFQLSKLGDMPL